MQKNLLRLPEWRILAILGIIALSAHLLVTFGSILAMFSDIFLVVILSWILAFVLEPLVNRITHKGVPRIAAAAIIYLFIAASATILISLAVPATIAQLSQLSVTLPALLPDHPIITSHVESFLANTLANSVSLATSLASTITGLLLILILSFYFLISRSDISRFIKNVIPDEYEEDYAFFEKVVNNTFASFLRIQVALGLALGAVTLVVLWILGINYALSTSVFAGILAMIPVVGSILFIIPVILASLTVSLQKMAIVVVVIILASQLVYNVLAPKLLGSVLNIHPIVVLLSFLVGYKVAGVWGAVFAVPVASVLAIVGKELIKHWNEEADK